MNSPETEQDLPPDSLDHIPDEVVERLLKFFSIGNYLVIEDRSSGGGSPYVTVNLPPKVEPWVRALRKGRMKRTMAELGPTDKLEEIARLFDKAIGTFSETEEEETAMREAPAIKPVLEAVFGGIGGTDPLTKRHRELVWELFYEEPFYNDVSKIISWPLIRMMAARRAQLESAGVDSPTRSGILYNEHVLGQAPYMRVLNAGFDRENKDRFVVFDSTGEEVVRSPGLKGVKVISPLTQT